MGKLSFIIGGTRSGKSTYSLEIAKNTGTKIAFIATAPYYDDDMRKRIEKHQTERPESWHTYEEQKELVSLLKKLENNYDTVLIDCLTLYITNLMLDSFEEKAIYITLDDVLKTVKAASYQTIIVSNELGMGVHPENKMAREFRDIAGRCNQLTATNADDVYFVVAGIPIKIKTEGVNKSILNQ
jgi:adenosylcobinamide kinase/adenosylcobinamide-phosphate guanylyltransferase